jgi:two-component system chemotaxis sensor kinase CheA
MSDADVFNLVFCPGFSTKDTITDISGRGVGLDAVKATIAEL